ncbi:putative short chain dehydrogenase/reductase [Podospora didyma]|uniref:Short chain dehydrogenase/reductase n=1 Tax=Podospora didyma TaxID=330526 RepID=A0AAE0NU24_9PEZI|nr:putative short chain dehydrogenase/reductase [Podospora didyma]
MATDKTIVLVTGANSGIGLETVIHLSKSSPNYHIILCSRSQEKGEKALSSIQSAHGSSLQSPISVLQLDVTSAESIAAAKSHLDSTFSGHLDVLVQNAGVMPYQPLRDNSALTSFRETFETNVFGAAMLTDALAPLLQKSAEARIIYVSSGLGSITLRLDPGDEWRAIQGTIYRSSKAALDMLAACHRVEFAGWGCKVCAFNPGFCVTNLSGEEGRKRRVEMGARPASDAGRVLVDVISGKRDADVAKNGMVDVDGGVLPW